MPPAAAVGTRKRARIPATSLRSRFQGSTDRLQDLGVPEGLGDVGRCAKLQPLEHLDFLPLGGEHDDGNGGERWLGLHRPAHLASVPLGQHDVQQHDVRVRPPDELQGLLTVARGRGLVPRPLQQDLQGEHDVRLVLHDQHPRRPLGGHQRRLYSRARHHFHPIRSVWKRSSIHRWSHPMVLNASLRRSRSALPSVSGLMKLSGGAPTSRQASWCVSRRRAITSWASRRSSTSREENSPSRPETSSRSKVLVSRSPCDRAQTRMAWVTGNTPRALRSSVSLWEPARSTMKPPKKPRGTCRWSAALAMYPRNSRCDGARSHTHSQSARPGASSPATGRRSKNSEA